MDDFLDAIAFMDAALELERRGVDRRHVFHRALVCAALIHYARPFSGNEHPNPSKRRKDAAERNWKPSFPLAKIFDDPTDRKLHRVVLNWRNKVLAHAESKYFPARMIRVSDTVEDKQLGTDFDLQSRRTYPSVDLGRLKKMAVLLRCAGAIDQVNIGIPLRRARTRSRRKLAWRQARPSRI